MSRPRVLFVGRGRFRFPLGRTLERRFEALSAELDWRQLGTSLDGKQSPDSRLVLARPSAIKVLDGPLYYLRMPRRIARELRGFQPDAVIAQGAQEAALALTARRLTRSKTAVILDLHGDWRAPTRLYGSKARRLLAPFADALARIALRRTDAVRTISAYTTELVRAEGIEPTAEFPAFMDLEPFTALPVVPLPDAPRALFVGVLERYKAFDVLADAWRRLVPAAPEATLHVVGQGALASIGTAARGRAAGSHRVDSVSDDRRSRGRARRVDAARAPVSLGGDGARGGRSRVPWPGRRGQPRGRHTGRRLGRRDRSTRPARRRGSVG